MKTQHQQTVDANANRHYGWQSGTASHSILHFLKARPDQSFSAYELAEKLGLSVSRVSSALVEGKRCGALDGKLDRNRCTRTKFYSFLAIPKRIVKNGAPKGPQGGKRHDWAMSQILATRAIKREEAAAIRKSNRTKEGVVIPPGLVVKVAVTPPNMGNRAYVDPANAPRLFRDIPLGATLEAA